MPQVVRLPAHVKEGEIRAYWDSTWEGTDVFVAGGDARQIVMMALCAPQMEPGDGGMGPLFEAYASRAVTQGVSMVDKLKAEGYDPETLVFSIMRKDAAPSPDEPPSDMRARLEHIQTRIVSLYRTLEDEGDHKSVYVFDDSEMDEMRRLASDCETAISDLIDDMPA
jgi:hypothetical protein